MASIDSPIETEIADFWIDEEGIVHIRFKPTARHGIDEARIVVDTHNALAKGTACPVLADIQDAMTGADRAVREHYISEESARYKTGMAMVVRSPIQRMMGNIFFKLSRPPYPTRLFSQQSEAIEWLRGLETHT